MEFGHHEGMRCWQDMELPAKLKKLVNDKILTDCEFLVGPEDHTAEAISGHKVMFVMQSPVFENMMNGTFAEAKKDQIIRIKDIFPQDFKNFRDLIYNNDFNNYSNFNILEIFELYRIADKYLASSISRDCIKYLLSIKESLEIRKLLMLFEFGFEIRNDAFRASVEKVISTRQVCDMLNDKINEFSFEIFYEYMLFISKLSILKPTSSNSNHGLVHNSSKTSQLSPSSSSIFGAINSYFRNNHLFERNVVIPIITEMEKTSDSEIEEKNLGEHKKQGIKNRETNNEIKKIIYDSNNTMGLESLFECESTEMQNCSLSVTKKKNLDKLKVKNRKRKNADTRVELESSVEDGKFNIVTFKRKLLELVKFNEMSSHEFINGPGKSNLLGADEKYRLLAELCGKSK